MAIQEFGSSFNWRKVAVPTVMVAGLAAGAMFSPIGIASAQEAPADEAPADEAPADEAPADEASTEQASESGSSDKAAHGNKEGKAEYMEAVAGALGITVDELAAGFEEGKTLGEIAEEYGIERGVLVSALTELGEDRIEQALADGKIDEAEAAEMKGNLPERVEARIDQVPGENNGNKHGAGEGDRPERGEGDGTTDTDAA